MICSFLSPFNYFLHALVKSVTVDLVKVIVKVRVKEKRQRKNNFIRPYGKLREVIHVCFFNVKLFTQYRYVPSEQRTRVNKSGVTLSTLIKS